ncbi:MAG: helix-turn-helix domain-containing protein [Actinomycetota bacterium]|nr:helix-turn-helix domain-containing protein [Actinomycetota bacterium]
MSEWPASPDDRHRIQSIERCFAVLLAFDADLPRPTSTELATATGLSRPTVRRILITLQHMGYVASVGNRWRLTPRVLSIGQHFTATHSIVEVAQPHLKRLADQTGESASLAVLDGTDVVYVARVPVRRIMSIDISPGSRVPAAATSMGRVLLAWADEAVIDRVLGAGLPALTSRTVTDRKTMRGLLREVQSQGWSVVAGELDPELISISVPLRNHTGDVVAAVASATTVSRATPEQLVTNVLPHLQAAATRLGTELGQPRGAQQADHRDGFF